MRCGPETWHSPTMTPVGFEPTPFRNGAWATALNRSAKVSLANTRSLFACSLRRGPISSEIAQSFIARIRLGERRKPQVSRREPGAWHTRDCIARYSTNDNTKPARRATQAPGGPLMLVPCVDHKTKHTKPTKLREDLPKPHRSRRIGARKTFSFSSRPETWHSPKNDTCGVRTHTPFGMAP